MKIAVIGAGHMGSWLIRELARSHDVGVHDLDRARARKTNPGTLLDAPADLGRFQPEMLINAVSLQRTVEAFEAALPYLPSGCALVDIASVKGRIPEYYQACGFRFASIHPMFGPTFADIENLRNENVIIIKESDPSAAGFFRDFFGRLGLKIYESSFQEHDQVIAYSLTLPFTSTMVFSACLTDPAVPGTTFKKHLEIAKGLLAEDDYLLAEIIFNPYSLPQLDMITSRLEFLKHVVRQRDIEEAVKFFNRLRKNLRPQSDFGKEDAVPSCPGKKVE
jgi:prephenate dehydrogenase